MRLLLPEPMKDAPKTPVFAILLLEPPTRLARPLAFGSMRNARAPLTRSSRGWLSVVPRKFTPAVVPAFPVSFQRLVPLTPPTVVALTLVRPEPLPAKLPLKLFAALLKVTVLPYTPEGRPPLTIELA